MEKTDPIWDNNGDMVILKDGRGTIIDQRADGGYT
jgi:hypothetical protein